ncbi:MAG TPA: UDP-N-acetylglucosamine 2-epimerase (non-hydrolyzing) [Verrucomicrobiae bacterium]|nr:UDP-N-acetylglucosamine 2-epimerase (non-hydrolyzing) [Verrucomicrobiae bacterium]
MRIATVVGTRPQLIKAAVLQPLLRARHVEVLVDTGQHYDDVLAGAFVSELGLAPPDHHLGVGGGSATEQTAAMLGRLEPILAAERPDVVIVYGDTNSTLAGSIVAAQLGIPLAHVEAGLRSFDRRMPEEVNRVIADHLATWSFAPTPTAVRNLAAEGVSQGVYLVGDLMQDLASRMSAGVRDPAILARIEERLAGAAPGLHLRPGGYLFATVHRAENRQAQALHDWAELLATVASAARPVVLALHPGTSAALEAAGVRLAPTIRVIEPQGYRTTLVLELHSAAVLTDSGGVQREAAWLGVPCLILRSTTEWLEAVHESDGRMVVVGLDRERAVATLARLAPLDSAPAAAAERARTFQLAPAGAGEAIVAALEAGRPE